LSLKFFRLILPAFFREAAYAAVMIFSPGVRFCGLILRVLKKIRFFLLFYLKKGGMCGKIGAERLKKEHLG